MTYDKRKVTALVFAKNEAEGLASVIRGIRRYAGYILVVDGHSTDDTRDIVARARAGYMLDRGKGRGEAVRSALARVKTDVIVLCDADGSYAIDDIPQLVLPIFQRRADLVIASRHTGGSFDRPMTVDSLLRTVGSNVATILVNKRFHTKLTDVHYGFRAISRKSAQALHLTANGHAIEQEMVIEALKRGYRVREIPSRELARGWGQSKLKTHMGIPIFFHLLRQVYT